MAEQNQDQPVAPAPKPAASDIKPVIPSKNGKKADTTRIDLAAAKPAPPKPAGEVKKATARLGIATGQMPAVVGPAADAIKKTTVRVQLDDIRKSETQHLGGPKQRTSRVDVGDVLKSQEDVLKRRTGVMFPGPDATGSAPRTIKIGQPGAPGTASFRKADTAPAALSPVEPATVEESRKRETARIELPAGAAQEAPPTTRRKTIKIKRPDASTPGTRPLVITQAPSDIPVAAFETRVKTETDEPGVVFFLAALAASLVVIGLLTVQGMTLHSFSLY